MARASIVAYEARREIGKPDWSPPAAVVNSRKTPPSPPQQGDRISSVGRKPGFQHPGHADKGPESSAKNSEFASIGDGGG